MLRFRLFTRLALLGAVFAALFAPLAPPRAAQALVSRLTYLPLALGKPQQVVPSAAACKLPEAANWGTIGLGFPRYADRLPSTGVLRVKVLFVDFSDAPAAVTSQSLFALMDPLSQDFFAKNSYGRLSYSLDPLFSWLRMGKPSTGYGFASLTADLHRQFIQEAVTLADSQVDFSAYQSVVVIANPAAPAIPSGPAFTSAPAWGGVTADGKTFYNAVSSGADLTYWGGLWLNHETGHTLGLPDLYAYGADQHRFAGPFDIMGLISGSGHELMAYPRWLLGWLDDTQVYCLSTTGTVSVELSAVELPGGIKAVMVPVSATKAVVVESRRAQGYDAALTREGALVYTVDTSIATGSGPIKVQPETLADKSLAPLLAGQSLAVSGVTIQVLTASAAGDVVSITK